MLWQSFASDSLTSIKLQDPATRYATTGVGTNKMAEYGEMAGTLLSETFTNRRIMYFRNAATGASTYITLPADSLAGFSGARLAMTSVTATATWRPARRIIIMSKPWMEQAISLRRPM
jgi:hypothetical protein